jgi:hypothetical protein
MEKCRFDLFEDPIEKSLTRKIYLILGVFLGITSLCGLIVEGLRGVLLQFNTLIFITNLILSSGYILQSLQIIKFKKRLYLEFEDTFLKFRLKLCDSETIIKYSEIDNIEFIVNKILFNMKDSNVHRFEVSEFGYFKIQQIKEKLDILKKHIA